LTRGGNTHNRQTKVAGGGPGTPDPVPQGMRGRIPRYPLLTWPTWRASQQRVDIGCVLDAGHLAFTTNGRMAMVLALQRLGIGPGDEVLLPAYHCPSMVSPVNWTGACARFYKLQPDLTPDLEDLLQQVSPCTRVVVAAHFFGFPADLGALRRRCDELGLTLIEDCAHTVYGGSKDNPVGSLGDYAVASLMKFYPVTDGGCLCARQDRVDTIALRSGGAGFEARAPLNALERAVAFGRLPGLSSVLQALFSLKDSVREWLKRPPGTKLTAHGAQAEDGVGPQDIDPAMVGTQMSLFSRLVVRCSGSGSNIARRRAAYTDMLKAFSNMPGCHAVLPVLPEGVAPYVFPLWVDQPDAAWPQMQQTGLPVMRWDELSTDAGDVRCNVTSGFAHHLIQIPCHQGLTRRELSDLIAGVSSAIIQSRRHQTVVR